MEIAVVLDKTTPVGTSLSPGIRNAIQLAWQLHPKIRGFAVKLNDTFDGPCGNDKADANASTAQNVVSNPQNVAVIGHMCSTAFAGQCQATPTALSTYDEAGVVTINGSTTIPCLPGVGPSVFNGVAVPGDDVDVDKWYGQVKALPSDWLWQQIYKFRFGVEPTDFADLYFDATNLLLTRLAQASEIENGKLVIDRAKLARAVRNTTNFPGVTCTISLDTGYRINDLSHCTR